MGTLERARSREQAAAAEKRICSPCQACEVRELSVCGVLRPDEFAQLTAILTTLQITPGQALFYEGDPAEHVYNVTEGCVRLSKMLVDGRRQITGFLFPGDFLGLAFNDTYAYTAEAVNEVHLCRFPRSKMEALFDELPHLEKRLLSMASNELIAAQDQMLLLGRKSAQEKISSFLLMLSRWATRRGQPADPVDLPMTRADIADYLGLTVETVSRTFTMMSRKGLIDLANPNQVALSSRPEIEALAAGNTD